MTSVILTVQRRRTLVISPSPRHYPLTETLRKTEIGNEYIMLIHVGRDLPMGTFHTVFQFHIIINHASKYESASGLSTVALVYLSILGPLPQCLNYFHTKISPEIQQHRLPTFLFKIFLAVLGFLHFHINFRINLSIYT